MNSTIRRAGLADLAALIALERCFPGDRLSARSFRHLLTHARADVWVAADASELLGNAVVLYRRHSTRGRLYSLVVAPSARGRGIARALVEAAETAAAAAGARHLYLEVRCDNAAAIGLYRKLGYHPVARLPRYYEDGQDAIRLERPLALNGSPARPRDSAARRVSPHEPVADADPGRPRRARREERLPHPIL